MHTIKNKKNHSHLALIQKYTGEYYREIEERFAQMLSENNDVLLSFIRGQGAFTDGINIVIDPESHQLYKDQQALKKTEDYLGLDSSISASPGLALRLVTRAQNIHETRHILYTTFPMMAISDKRGTTVFRKKILAMISNIIEDAYIEAAGSSVFDNIEHILVWRRIAEIFAESPDQGSVGRVFGDQGKRDSHIRGNLADQEDEPDEIKKSLEEKKDDEKKRRIMDYLNYMIDFLLYPMIKQDHSPENIEPYIQDTKPFFIEGSLCPDPDQRYSYTQKIFDAIQDLIPENEEFPEDFFRRRIEGYQTHGTKKNSPVVLQRKGKNAAPLKLLMRDENGKLLLRQDNNPHWPLKKISDGEVNTQFTQKSYQYWEKIRQGILTEVNGFILEDHNNTHDQNFFGKVQISGASYPCSLIHKNMTIEEVRPPPNLRFRKAWKNLYSKYRLSIVNWSNRFAQILKIETQIQEEKHLFGTAISSRRFGDIKKRYWYRSYRQKEVPELGVLLLIDGSGSMEGKRREASVSAAVILHEVLKTNGIPHCIVEHRAIFDEPLLRHRILVDFNSREEEKYNILSLKAAEGTREGLSLYWAEQYIQKKCSTERKLILIISDGEPYHIADDNILYYPPVSTQDTANAVRKIRKRGISIVAMALDEPNDYACFQDLKKIYPNTVSCNDVARLAGQLLKVIVKQLE